jgi:multidrug transporter EmrE-like cation transporter
LPWYIGISANSFLFVSIWAITTKYVPTVKGQFILQIAFLPLVYLVNVWYGKSVSVAAAGGVTLFVVTVFSTVISFLLSLAVGFIWLKQPVSWIQLIGAGMVLGGVVLLKV